jgi:hypothetical protein
MQAVNNYRKHECHCAASLVNNNSGAAINKKENKM